MIEDMILLSFKSSFDDEQETIPKLLSYKIQSLTNEELILKSNFSNPLHVSSLIHKDLMNLVILENRLFKAKSDGYTLEANYTILGIEVPP
jgi:hypothetical protein